MGWAAFEAARRETLGRDNPESDRLAPRALMNGLLERGQISE